LTLLVGLKEKTKWWGADVVICLGRGADGLADAAAIHRLLLL